MEILVGALGAALAALLLNVVKRASDRAAQA